MTKTLNGVGTPGLIFVVFKFALYGLMNEFKRHTPIRLSPIAATYVSMRSISLIKSKLVIRINQPR